MRFAKRRTRLGELSGGREPKKGGAERRARGQKPGQAKQSLDRLTLTLLTHTHTHNSAQAASQVAQEQLHRPTVFARYTQRVSVCALAFGSGRSLNTQPRLVDAARPGSTRSDTPFSHSRSSSQAYPSNSTLEPTLRPGLLNERRPGRPLQGASPDSTSLPSACAQSHHVRLSFALLLIQHAPNSLDLAPGGSRPGACARSCSELGKLASVDVDSIIRPV